MRSDKINGSNKFKAVKLCSYFSIHSLTSILLKIIYMVIHEMKNLSIYGLAKVRCEHKKRGDEIEANSFRGMTGEECIARVLAWDAFIRDEYSIDYNLEKILPVIEKQYYIAIDAFTESYGDASFHCSLKEFGSYFNDEIDVIAKAVTNRWAQLMFKICRIGLITAVSYGVIYLATNIH